MKEKLEKEHLITIVVPLNKVTWINRHEAWINDRLFDIHSVSKKKDYYTFTGLYDETETILKKRFTENTRKNNQENKLLARFFKSLQQVFFLQNDTNDTLFSIVKNLPEAFSATVPVKPFRNILTPPPQA